LLVFGITGAVHAQVVTSEIRGTVLDQNGQPVVGAQVSVTDNRTNITTGALTNDAGRYYVSQLQPGGPYSVNVQVIGYRSETVAGINVTLSQPRTVDFQLQQTAVEVEPLTVSVTGADAVFSRTKTGQTTVLDPTEITTLPTIERNISEFILLSPYANQFEDAPSIAGKANRLNNIQVDGAVNNDVFGVGETGTPGGQANAKAITIEAIEEMQILVAPFDVRHSNFAGGLVNAVTRAGTNNWSGSAFGYFINESFVSDIEGREFGEFNDYQFGATLGGPIQKDKIFFFGAAELQLVDRPFEGFTPGQGNDFSSNIGADPAEAQELIGIFQNNFGVDIGTTGAAPIENPRTNLFGRLDFQLNPDHRLVLRHNYARGRNDLSCSRGSSSYCYTSSLAPFVSITNSSVAQLFSRLGDSWDNELLLNLSFIRDERDPAVDFGQVDVVSSGPDYRVGAERFSQANTLNQDIFQLTNNLTGRFGDHRVTFGTHNEYYNFFNLFEPGLLGVWEFDSFADLQANTPASYVRRVPVAGVPEDELAAQFSVIQLAFYVQDEWTVSDNFTITGGLRAEIPILPDSPRENTLFEQEFGFKNSDVPSGKILWQPRLGMNYQLGNELRTQLRGGLGLFAGRSPFVWISNAYGNTGIQSVDLSCDGANAPGFDPTDAPVACRDGSGAAEAGLPIINVIDEDFKFPLDFKASFGVDQELPKGFIVSAEVLYSKAIEEVFFEEINLVPLSGVDPVEGRRFHGTPTADGCGSRGGCFEDNRVSDEFRNVVNLTNRDDSRAWIFTFGLQRQFSDWLRLRTSYTYADVKDVQVQQSSQATSNIGRNAIDDDINNPDLRDSNYEVENKLVLAGTGRWDFGENGWFLEVTPTFIGQSGLPISYVARGDPNGDGYRNPVISRDNDLIYIPNDVSELAWDSPEDAADFAAFLADNPCLQEQAGSIMQRGSCRNPWSSSLDVQAVVGLPKIGYGNIEAVINFQNIFESTFEQTRVDRGVEVLRVQGRENDLDTGRFVYSFSNPSFSILSPQSNFRFQLGVRYRF
jgi:hypothetical protein